MIFFSNPERERVFSGITAITGTETHSCFHVNEMNGGFCSISMCHNNYYDLQRRMENTKGYCYVNDCSKYIMCFTFKKS